jgi:threonine dehydrogenase-like Zn-dependent dehydrogenase
MIRAACVREPGVVEIIERPSAILGENEVRLRIEAVGVCGSDVALLAGSIRTPFTRSRPGTSWPAA